MKLKLSVRSRVFLGRVTLLILILLTVLLSCASKAESVATQKPKLSETRAENVYYLALCRKSLTSHYCSSSYSFAKASSQSAHCA